MPCKESSTKHLSSCRIRKSWATCARRRKITIAGYQAWPRSRPRCGKITGSKEDPQGARHARLEPCGHGAHVILRDARRSALLRMREPSALLRVEQPRRRIHDHFDQADAVMRQAALERGREFG